MVKSTLGEGNFWGRMCVATQRSESMHQSFGARVPRHSTHSQVKKNIGNMNRTYRCEFLSITEVIIVGRLWAFVGMSSGYVLVIGFWWVHIPVVIYTGVSTTLGFTIKAAQGNQAKTRIATKMIGKAKWHSQNLNDSQIIRTFLIFSLSER